MTLLAPSVVLPRWRSPALYPISRGAAIADFAEDYLTVLKGPLAGDPMLLLLWEKWLLEALFEVRPDGRYRYRRGLIGVGRQNGKSITGSTVGLETLTTGPVGSEVYSAAGDRQQARIVFGEAKRQVEQSPLLSRILKLYRDAIENPHTGSVYRVLSAEATLQQGLSPYLVIFDEVHVQRNEDLWNALAMGMGAREDAMLLGITTAGYDEETLCGRLYEYGRRVAQGEIVDESFFMAWWEPKNTLCAVDDREAWAQANPSYAEGVMVEEDLEISARQDTEPAFRRFRLNQWVRLAGMGWMPLETWLARAVEEFEPPPPGSPIVLGFDGSVDRDATALVAIDLERRVAWPVGIWEKDPLDDAWQVPRDEVDAAVDTCFDTWDVRAFGADPAWWRSELQGWAQRYGEGRVLDWPVTNARMGPATAQTYAHLKEDTLRHSGDETLTRHVLNAVMKDLGSRGITLKKERMGSTRYIDGAVALVIAVDMMERFSDPEPEPPTVYFF